MAGEGAGQSCSLCHGFMRIPPLIRGSNGKVYANPDYDMVKRFHLTAAPFGGTIPAGDSEDFVLTVPAEEESLGDFLVNELFMLTDPSNARDLAIEILSNQSNLYFQNAPVFNTLMMGNAHLNCCLPCCFLIQATNSAVITVENREAVPVDVRIVARGKRFLPRGKPELRMAMLEYWNSVPSSLYFLTFDATEVTVAAGTQVTAYMTVPGTGDFEVKDARCEVISAGATTADNIDVSVSEGVGRRWENELMPLGAFQATPTLSVTGFPGNLFRAASACHCPAFGQLFKRNTRVRHTLHNQGPADATVRITYAGCMHYVDECPPGRSIDRIRSLEPTIGPFLVPQGDYCPPADQEDWAYAAPPDTMPEYEFQTGLPAPAPAPGPILSAPAYQQPLAPSSTGPLPFQQAIASNPSLQYAQKYYTDPALLRAHGLAGRNDRALRVPPGYRWNRRLQRWEKA